VGRLQQIVIERHRCSHALSFHTNYSTGMHLIMVSL
jgi:hypothetical protein